MRIILRYTNPGFAIDLVNAQGERKTVETGPKRKRYMIEESNTAAKAWGAFMGIVYETEY